MTQKPGVEALGTGNSPDYRIGTDSSVETAREAVLQRFISKVLLPRLNAGGPLPTAEQLVEAVVRFKKSYSSGELLAAGQFLLIPAAEERLRLELEEEERLELRVPLGILSLLIRQNPGVLLAL